MDHIRQGRIGPDDELSQDRDVWLQVKSDERFVGALVVDEPEIGPDNGPEAGPDNELADERRSQDRRQSNDRRQGNDRRHPKLPDVEGPSEEERRMARERRQRESEALIKRRARLDGIWQSMRPKPRDTKWQPIVFSGLFVGTLVFVGVLLALGDGEPETTRDCTTPASPKVNWSHCNLGDQDLKGADLSDALLRGVRLSRADLRGAILSGTDLAFADLSAAKLSGSRLDGAKLTGADLRNADLRNADLRNADLRNADLNYADLSGARLDGAKLIGATFFQSIGAIKR